MLVEALSDLLPDEVVGQSKRTFTLPWEVWLRGPLGVRLSQDLANLTPPLRQYMNPRAVRGAWQNFVIGQTNWSRPWSLYVLNEWVRRHVTECGERIRSRPQKPFTPPRLQPPPRIRGLKGRENHSGCTSLESMPTTAMPPRRSLRTAAWSPPSKKNALTA